MCLLMDCAVDVVEVVQMLYLRLLFRQHSWIPTTSIRYKEIPNIPYALTLLKEQRLVEDSQYGNAQ